MYLPTLKAEIMFVSPTWTDVTQYLLKGADTRRGSSRVESPVIRYEPGHATIRLDNRDRRFDPTNLAGPYVVGGVSKVTAMRPCRLSAIWNSVTYPLFRGFVDEFDVEWIDNVHSEVTVPITDGFKVLANKKRSVATQVINNQVYTVTYGDAEDAGARVSRILDSAFWSATDRTVSTGISALQATDLGGDALSELLQVAESEIGELYIDASGKVVFRNRHAVILDTRSTTVQLTLSGVGFETKLNTDDGTLWNEVKTTRIGGVEQVEVDSASVTENQYKTYEKSGLYLSDDITASNYAEWILYISKNPEVRFDQVTVSPRADPTNLFPQILSREIGDRIRITYTPPGGGSAISRDGFIRGITHTITQENWKTTWTLQSATRYIANFFVLGTSSLNVNIMSY